MSRFVVFVFALFGCAPDQAAFNNAETARVIEEGTPEASGVIAFLNDSSTTFTILDVDAALDSPAATNLIAHRNGPDGTFGTGDDDRYGDIAEVDAVKQVGDATLRSLLSYAEAEGWILPDEPLYGVVEGVELTQQEAVDILRVANGATLAELDDDVPLDSRAAQGILDNRPFGLVEDVALVPYVGATAIERLADYGAAHPVVLLTGEQSLPALEIATAGLWFTSESDYPLDIWGLPNAVTVTEANAMTVLEAAYLQREDQPTWDERVPEASSLAWFFDRYTVEQDWWEDSQREDAPKWQALRTVFETQLASPQVFRVGVRSGDHLMGAIEVFVFGVTADGAMVGIRTVSDET